jgi:hypothetical protein
MLKMQRTWVCTGVVVAMLLAGPVAGLDDWKSALARKAVGRVAREAIGEAVENNMQGLAFDASVGVVGREARDVQQLAEFGSNADSAFETAMTAADVASSLDKASDAVEAARKVNKARKVIKRVR